jgi:hypothetical protein
MSVAALTAPETAREPALRFWLSYAQREGALVEEQRESALVLLPEHLQDQAELPEEVTVTASPDLAREEGAALLIAGHPAVQRAAEELLARGDAGSAFLPWPRSRPPTRAELLARARELGVTHGRIDSEGEPIAAYMPLLRLGAMVSYEASLRLRFQEQEQVLLDARACLEAWPRLHALALGGRLLSRPDGHGRVLEADLRSATAAAHALIEARAHAREHALAAQAHRELTIERARAEHYYERALASIDRRRANAAPDRLGLLDAQAQATAAERARRLVEIEDEYRPRHRITPFRLQLIHAPAYLLPLSVRRGAATFSLTLTWVLGAGEFAPVRCPSCGATEPLVATRRLLGCRACASGA